MVTASARFKAQNSWRPALLVSVLLILASSTYLFVKHTFGDEIERLNGKLKEAKDRFKLCRYQAENSKQQAEILFRRMEEQLSSSKKSSEDFKTSISKTNQRLKWELQSLKISHEEEARKCKEKIDELRDIASDKESKFLYIQKEQPAKTDAGALTGQPKPVDNRTMEEIRGLQGQIVDLKRVLGEKSQQVEEAEREAGRLREDLGRQEALVARLSDEVRLLRRPRPASPPPPPRSAHSGSRGAASAELSRAAAG